ncbi:MAG: GCN5-related N-acetyltransferase [Segetibacter sp.]|nr:GCN5-related N-acetyltransferase [Segetibacter sp.]
MPLKILDHGSREYKHMIDLRYQILRKPLGLEFNEEDLKKEESDILIGAYEDEEMLGCCLLTAVSKNNVRLRQMAVKPGLQGKGIGRALMQFAENISRDRGYKKISMHARKSAVGFYEKQGYIVVGEEFEEVTIPHYVMEKSL